MIEYKAPKYIFDYYSLAEEIIKENGWNIKIRKIYVPQSLIHACSIRVIEIEDKEYEVQFPAVGYVDVEKKDIYLTPDLFSENFEIKKKYLTRFIKFLMITDD